MTDTDGKLHMRGGKTTKTKAAEREKQFQEKNLSADHDACSTQTIVNVILALHVCYHVETRENITSQKPA